MSFPSTTFLKDLRKIYAGLNSDEIRGAAHHDVKVGLMASSELAYQQLEDFLAPPSLESTLRLQALRATARVAGDDYSRYDFIVCEPGVPAPPNGFTVNYAQPARTYQAIAHAQKDIETAVSRVFVPLRKPIAQQIVMRVSRENALFSLVTALPNVVPSLIELPWAIGEFATDSAFLTMNQVRMALTLAAASDRPVGYMEQKAEVGAIIAGAFGWRALARELAGKIPMGGGLIPKAAIAFAGTYAAGMGIEKLHRTGAGFDRRERRDAYNRAYSKGKELAGELVPSLRRG